MDNAGFLFYLLLFWSSVIHYLLKAWNFNNKNQIAYQESQNIFQILIKFLEYKVIDYQAIEKLVWKKYIFFSQNRLQNEISALL